MIIVTGAAGFIGSVVVGHLNAHGYRDLVLVDRFDRPDHQPNYASKAYTEKVEREQFFTWVKGKEDRIQAVIHLGARTDTTEQDASIFEHLNLRYSQQVWQLCARHQVPLIYASSAATYGGGEHGYSDAQERLPLLHPLNPYGESKHAFDLWAIAQEEAPFFWAGLKFFNVYGPNEYHKGRMASVIFHAYNQIQKNGSLRLFRSHRPDYADGEQKRDFVYVKDVAEVIRFLLENRPANGIYNLGSGSARTFNALGLSVFRALGLPPKIDYIDTPADIRESYQYYTQAEMDKLRSTGYSRTFTSLEDGTDDYVKHYLVGTKYY